MNYLEAEEAQLEAQLANIQRRSECMTMADVERIMARVRQAAKSEWRS